MTIDDNSHTQAQEALSRGPAQQRPGDSFNNNAPCANAMPEHGTYRTLFALLQRSNSLDCNFRSCMPGRASIYRTHKIELRLS